jgi:hypothetical protein
MHCALDKAIREEDDTRGEKENKALQLLSTACSMYMKPNSPNEPFGPMMVHDGKRTMIPDDYSPEVIELFGEYSREVDNPWMQARLADIAWLKRMPRNPEFALIAIDAYRRIPLAAEMWNAEGRACWARAIVLAKLLNKAAGSRLKELEEALSDALLKATAGDGGFPVGIAQLLRESGIRGASASEIAQKLEALAKYHKESGDPFQTGDCYKEASAWYTIAREENKAYEMVVCEAESMVRKADLHTALTGSGHMAAAFSIVEAIQTYRSIPRTFRDAHDVDQRVAELRGRMGELDRKTLDEMGTIESPLVDITQEVEETREHMSGKEWGKALLLFANLYAGADVKSLETNAKKGMANTSILSMAETKIISSDGRVVGKKPALAAFDRESEEYQSALFYEEVGFHSYEVISVTLQRIEPALDVLLLEHRVREHDCVFIAKHSPVVPRGRETIVGKGLFAGFERDFMTALHLLIPQLEHIIRSYLKSAGATTTTLDAQGIEMEKSLGSLVDMPEMKELFGEDLTFEIKAIFCSPAGPNLRNDGLHGLLEVEAFSQPSAVYAWWFMFRLVFNTFYNANRAPDDKADAGEEPKGAQ